MYPEDRLAHYHSLFSPRAERDADVGISPCVLYMTQHLSMAQ